MNKELIPIVVATMLWGQSWAAMTIQARCDNQAVVEIINQRSSKDQEAMHLLCCLSFAEARFGCFITAKHISGIQTTLVDVPFFLSHFPQASRVPVKIPSEILEVLINQWPDWTSIDWASLFRTTIYMV